MALRNGEEIQSALRDFVARWKDFRGTERAEAQTFLNDLFACYGSDRRAVGAELEDNTSSQGFMDLYWRDVCIIEMKAPSQATRLDQHRKQALDYWRESSDSSANRPAPPYVVLCAFRRFEIWEPGRYPKEPRAVLPLEELPDRYEALLFLAGRGEEPIFDTADRSLTTHAATTMAKLYRSMLIRQAASKEKIGAFVLQTVWTMFAEDFGMIRGHVIQHLAKAVLDHPKVWNTYITLGGLFDALGDPEYPVGQRTALLKEVPYAGGDLFSRPSKIDLVPEELEIILEACGYDWREVNPTIFGSLMEGFLSNEERHDLGAHYTHESDIMKIVRPVIVRPWTERIEATTTPAEARQVLDELCAFRVLDPACGCGNFLYVAYRELRALEVRLKQRIVSLAGETGLSAPPGVPPYFPLRNMLGIDLNGIAVQIARLTLWMGQRQMSERFGYAENPLPLPELPGIQRGDALFMPWPEADCVIGNPPFLGSQHIRSALGDGKVEWLRQTFNIGVKDYCVYWFRKTHDHLMSGQRAGLVGTNSISQNRARSASLEYITAHGGVITDAVSTQKWPGEAKVHVSLANWIKHPDTAPPAFFLDGQAVSGITAELRSTEASTGDSHELHPNKGRCFQGVIPLGEGFILSAETADSLLRRTEAPYRDVVRPYLVGEDIAEDPGQQARRWIIDFAQLPLERAMKFSAALEIVRERVKPLRDSNSRKSRRERWWLFGEQAVGMRRALDGLPRYIAGIRVGKRPLFAWADAWTCPSDLTNVFAFDDDYSMGVLSSAAHAAWAWSKSSTLKGDLRYTPTTVFMTFPWPDPVSEETKEQVAEAARKIVELRKKICEAEGFGLTRLYNLVEEGAYTDLRALHRELDEAVAAAYGWPKTIAQDSDAIVSRLLKLNKEIATGGRPYAPFGAQDDQGTLQLGI
ncbi:DNA methyltransferase [Microbispora bryophytorum]|uniref:DNA methyltransferase n=1 Tax=Microbispora bryophytorum TaxID=1460882 RepID=UPI0033DCC3D0